jgi:hypothetical protein
VLECRHRFFPLCQDIIEKEAVLYCYIDLCGVVHQPEITISCSKCEEIRVYSSLSCCPKCAAINMQHYVGTYRSEGFAGKSLGLEQLREFIPVQVREQATRIDLYKCNECNCQVAIIDITKNPLMCAHTSQADRLLVELERRQALVNKKLELIQSVCKHVFVPSGKRASPGHRAYKCAKCNLQQDFPCVHEFEIPFDGDSGIVTTFRYIEGENGESVAPEIDIYCKFCVVPLKVKADKYCSNLHCQHKGLDYLGRFCPTGAWRENRPRIELSDLPTEIRDSFLTTSSHYTDVYICPVCKAVIVIYDDRIYLK